MVAKCCEVSGSVADGIARDVRQPFTTSQKHVLKSGYNTGSVGHKSGLVIHSPEMSGV